MYIIRDGKKIELTGSEAWKIFEEVQFNNTELDVRQVSDVPEDKIKEVTEFCVRRLEHSDYLWDEYWSALKEAIKNQGYDLVEDKE